MHNYLLQVRRFSTGARLFLLASFLVNAGLTLFALLFNLYLLELGFREDFVGATSSAATLSTAFLSLPVGWLAMRWGYQPLLVLSFVTAIVGQAGQALASQAGILLALATLQGFSQALYWVSLPPFLVEISGPRERNHLFAVNIAAMLLAGVVGNFLGGQLPSLLLHQGTTLYAYRAALLVGAGVSALALLPMALIRPGHFASSPHPAAAIVDRWGEEEGRKNLRVIVLASTIMGVGVGAAIPFFNVFFVQAQGATAGQIGTLFAFNALLITLSALIAPALVDRWGLLKVIVASRGIGGLALSFLGWAGSLPAAIGFYLGRNLAIHLGVSVIDAFNMEVVTARQRAVAASWTTMTWHFAYATSSFLAGQWIVRQGYGGAFLIAGLATIANSLLFHFYFRDRYAHPGHQAG